LSAHLLFSSLLTPPPLCSPLFPYTTLFRSHAFGCHFVESWCSVGSSSVSLQRFITEVVGHDEDDIGFPGLSQNVCSWCCQTSARSEEHTSELQSRENLVCRLLLEKKKKEQK